MLRMESETLVVWGVGTFRTFRVYWALHELELSFSKRTVRTRTSDMDDANFLEVSPGKKIPALEHGGLVLSESGAIVSYLYDRFAVRPTPAAQRAQITRWSLFSLMELDATSLYVLRRHRDLPEIYGEAPAAVASGAEYFQRQAAVVADALGDGRPFIAGAHFSQADIHLVTCCDWARLYELSLPDTLTRYHEKQRSRPAYRAAIGSNRPEG